MFRWKLESTIFQFALVILIISEVLVLLMSSAVSTALIDFCVVGRVPGTQTYLAPEQTFLVSVIAAAVCFTTIFIQELLEVGRYLAFKISRRLVTSRA